METEMVSQLIDQFGMDVSGFARKLTFCSEDAQDLYQQTFLKLMELRVAIRKEENPRAFLFSIANGIWKNECRKLRRRARIAPSISISRMQEENEQIQDSADTQSQVLEQMQQEELRRAVERLEPKYKTPIILMYTFGMKVEEIAKSNIASGYGQDQIAKGKAETKDRNGGTRIWHLGKRKKRWNTCFIRQCSSQMEKSRKHS